MKTMMIAALLLLPLSALAQSDQEVGGVDMNRVPQAAPDLFEICDALPAGAMTEVSLSDDTTLAGRWAGHDGVRLYLMRDGRSAGIPASTVSALWVRYRATGKGLHTGSRIGALGGGAFLGAVAMLLAEMDDDGAPVLPLVTLGVVGGYVVGGLAGAGVGSALPDWECVYTSPGAPAARPDLPATRLVPSGFGCLNVLGGSARNLGLDEDGRTDFAWRIALEARTRSRFTYGLEYGRYATGHAERPGEPWLDPAAPTTVGHLGATLRLTLLDDSPRPFLVAGVGHYSWDDSFLGGSLGVGLDVVLKPTVSGIFEYRYHTNLQHLTETRPRLRTIMGGVRLSW